MVLVPIGLNDVAPDASPFAGMGEMTYTGETASPVMGLGDAMSLLAGLCETIVDVPVKHL